MVPACVPACSLLPYAADGHVRRQRSQKKRPYVYRTDCLCFVDVGWSGLWVGSNRQRLGGRSLFEQFPPLGAFDAGNMPVEGFFVGAGGNGLFPGDQVLAE